jgi:mono/diheme cytochrome c family protein
VIRHYSLKILIRVNFTPQERGPRERHMKERKKGTMKRWLALAVIGLLVGAGSASTGFGADASSGKALFEKSCAGCHGADGKGNPAMVKVLGEKGLNITAKDTTQKSDEQLLKVIAEGSGKMPASKLSKDEQKQALGYARSLAK